MRRREKSRDFDSKNSRDEDQSNDTQEDSSESDSGSEGYTVQQILDKKIENGKVYYFIKWEGYDSDDNTWEPIQHLYNVREMIDRFEKKHSKEVNPPPGRKNSKDISITTRQRKEKSKSPEQEIEQTRKKRIIDSPQKLPEGHEEKEKQTKPKTVFVKTINLEDRKIDVNPDPQPEINGNGKYNEPIQTEAINQAAPLIEQQNGIDVEKDENKDPEKAIRKHKTVKKKPKHGSLKCKDRPARVLSIRPSKNGFIFLIEWEPRSDGVVPEPTHVTSAEFKEHRPGFLIDFYESKIVIFRKKKDGKEEDGAKEIQEEKKQEIEINEGDLIQMNKPDSSTENKEISRGNINETENLIEKLG